MCASNGAFRKLKRRRGASRGLHIQEIDSDDESEWMRTRRCVVDHAVEADVRALRYVDVSIRKEVATAFLPKLYRWVLTRLRQQLAAPLFAQVDRWLIRHGLDGFSNNVRRVV